MNLNLAVPFVFLSVFLLLAVLHVYDLAGGEVAISGIGDLLVGAATVIGATAAILAQSTWKKQILWQQDRGLAVSILQAFLTFKRVSLEVRAMLFPSFDSTKSDDESTAAVASAFENARIYSARLTEAHASVEKLVAEAMIVWDLDFKNVMSEIAEVEHIALNAVHTGAALLNTKRSVPARKQENEDYQYYKEKVDGDSKKEGSLRNGLYNGEKALLTILKSNSGT